MTSNSRAHPALQDRAFAASPSSPSVSPVPASIPLRVHYSTGTIEWATPQAFFDRCARRFAFDLDVCATAENAKCDRFFTTEQDGLSQQWTGVCWMNPPYGRGIGAWLRKAYESSLGGATVVCLVPARTDTSWWHDYAMKGEVEFIRGRLKFGDRNKDAPFPCALVVFAPFAIADTHPKGGDAKQAPFMSGGGADRQSPQLPIHPQTTD